MNRQEGSFREEEQIVPSTLETEQRAPELITEACAKRGLEIQDEELRGQEEKVEPRAIKAVSGWRRYAGVAAAGLSLVAMGCSAAKEKPVSNEKPNIENSVDDKSQEKNKEFLGGIFERISGGEVTVKEDGNVVVFMGGKYYELGKDDMAKLAQGMESYRERYKRESSGAMKAFAPKTMNAARVVVEVGISRVGHEIPSDQLTDGMKNFKKSVEDISGGATTVEQEQGSGVKTKTTSASNAGDFLK